MVSEIERRIVSLEKTLVWGRENVILTIIKPTNGRRIMAGARQRGLGATLRRPF